jgi:hypothetical protein
VSMMTPENAKNISNCMNQMMATGLSYDMSRTILQYWWGRTGQVPASISPRGISGYGTPTFNSKVTRGV